MTKEQFKEKLENRVLELNISNEDKADLLILINEFDNANLYIIDVLRKVIISRWTD